MTVHQHRRAALLASTALVTLVLAACTNGGSAPPSPPSTSESPTTATSTPPATVPTATPTPTATSTPTPTPQPSRPAETATDVLTELDAPWDIEFIADTAFVSERDTGVIREVAADGSTREIATIAGVRHGGEGGLLGLAAADGQLYVYSTGEGGNRVQRYAIQGAPGSYALGAPTTILDGIPAANTHNGGRIAFGPDGMLYVATGDAGDRDAAQDPTALGGKILRLMPDGSIPSDNPIAGSATYSFGHRNVQGLAWAADGTMFASEFGQDTWDELNIIEPGANYGWPLHEGISGAAGFVDPIHQWSTDELSPSGIAIVGDTIFLAGLRGRALWSVSATGDQAPQALLDNQFGRLREVTLAPDGALWILTNNTDGRGDPGEGDDRILRVALEG